MHWPGDGVADADPLREPGARPPDPAVPGFAYGAFLLNKFTRWDSENRRLELYYLLSLGSPYQVQVMHTTLELLAL